MSMFDIRVGKHDPLRISETEFTELTAAIELFHRYGFRDGCSMFGTVRVVECGEMPFGLPVKDMIERGWLPGVQNTGDPELMDALYRFFEVSDEAELKALLCQSESTNSKSEDSHA